jgi:hypothetical protein
VLKLPYLWLISKESSMSIRRLISSVAVAGIVGASSLGIGDGIANASTEQSNSDTAVVQQVGWHGYGYGYGHGRGHGYGHWDGWPGFRWHPWGWGFHRW